MEANNMPKQDVKQESKTDLVSKVKDIARSKTAKLLMAGGLALATTACTINYTDTGMNSEGYPYYQNNPRGRYFNPYMFERNSLFMINGAQWRFSHFYPQQNMLYFSNFNGNSQVYFQISISNLPNYNFQYYNNGAFVPFQKNDYQNYWNNRDMMREQINNGRNYYNNNYNNRQQHPNNQFPLDGNYQNNIQKQKPNVVPQRNNNTIQKKPDSRRKR
jgi:hypothetical protein